MKTFLDTVATDLYHKYNGDLSTVTIVFPNKRASLFLNKALANITDKPMWSPQYTTISELFRQHTSLETGDRIKLVCDLYLSYKKITGSDEPLDRFYGWGELLINDFDDIDKHMADAQKVFSLLGDIHELDGVEYLTENQQQVLQQFFSNFSKDHNTELKKRFLKLWSKFHDIYTDFRQHLREQGIAYEGMLYRDVIEHLYDCESDFSTTTDKRTYIFIGFNLLHKVEMEMFSFFQKQGRAKFYWDYDVYYMKDNEAGKYIKQYLKYFPNELSPDNATYHNFGKQHNITFISSPTEDLQARYIAQWLTPERIGAGRRTAIVLADEGLLETVLHCLPPTVKSVNITTGYPLEKSVISSFVRLLSVVLHHRSYTLHNINGVLRHPLAKYISDRAAELHDNLNDNLLYYPSLRDLSVDENLAELFRPLQNYNDCNELNDRLLWAIKTIANKLPEDDDFLREAIFRMFTVLNRIKNLNPSEWSVSMYMSIIQQIVRGTTVPFHGEPIEGIQIMGVLETRNLDFEHLLLLSCNEGKLPAKINDTSFLPHSIRHGYGLTTIDNKVAIYAYYFHRLLQRTSDVHITYNSSTSIGQTGEMSRFMLQMIAESGLAINRKTLQAKQEANIYHPQAKEKTDDIINKLLNITSISPSALGTYLRCPIRFYYNYIANIKDDNNGDEEDMDARALGNIFHKAAELMYASVKGRPMNTDYIDSLLKEKGNVTLANLTDKAFRSELFQIKDTNRPTPRLNGLQLINREMVIKFLKHTLMFDRRYAKNCFTVLDTEQKFYTTIQVTVNDKTHDIKIGGTVDRLDMYVDTDGSKHLRVVDYKTGRINKPFQLADITDIFDPKNIKDHSDYFLQAMLYSLILSKKYADPISPILLYVQQSDKEDYEPHLFINKEPIMDIRNYAQEYEEGVKELVSTILNKQIPFTPTPYTDRCASCPYASFCS